MHLNSQERKRLVRKVTILFFYALGHFFMFCGLKYKKRRSQKEHVYCLVSVSNNNKKKLLIFFLSCPPVRIFNTFCPTLLSAFAILIT